MRLHFHLPTSFIGGGERQVEYLVKYLRPPYADDEPAIFITYQHDAITAFVERLGVPRVKVDSAIALADAIEAHAPDVFQFYTCALAYEALGMVAPRPRVVEVIHNVMRFPGDTFSYPKDRTDFLVCVSPHARLFAWTHARETPALVIPNGIDLERFGPAPGKRSPRPVVGFAGRLAPEKGIDTIVELARRLPYPVELVGQDFAGYGQRSLPNITVLPETATPETHYHRWWAFLSASPRESFGLAIAEAMACGCPPVVLDCGGIVPYLRHGHDALVVSDPAALAASVQDLVEGRVKLEPTARQFSAQEMARRYREAYASDLGRIRTPARPAPDPAAAPVPRVFRPVRSRPRVDGGVLGVTPPGWYGVVRALSGICDEFAGPEDAFDAINRLRPRLVVLGCYQDEWLPICRHARRRGARVVATWHASYILNEFHAINRTWMAQMLDAFRAGHIDYLATPHEGLARNWTHFGYPTAWLPNIVDEDLVPQPKLPGINIGLFGSGQNWKNMECQVAAAAMIPGATIHAHPLASPEVIQRLGIRIKVVPERLADAEYHRLLGSMGVNLCVSQSEVYSYLTAESFLMATPVLTGSITPLVRDGADDAPWLSLCSTPYFEDPIAIRDKLLALLEVKDELGPRLREHMLAINGRYRDQCANVLGEWVPAPISASGIGQLQASGETVLSLRIRDLPESIPLAVLKDPNGVPEPDCMHIARKGTLLPEVLSLIYWSARCRSAGCLVETVPINGFAAAVAFRGGMRHIAALCATLAVEAAVRATMAMQDDDISIMPSLGALARSRIRPTIVRQGEIFASDLEFGEAFRRIEHCLRSAELILAFAATAGQAHMLVDLAHARGLELHQIDEDGGKRDRDLAEILGTPFEAVPPQGAWLVLVEPVLAQEMLAARAAAAQPESAHGEFIDFPPGESVEKAIARRSANEYLHEELYRAWADAIWHGARVDPIEPCRMFIDYFSKPGASVIVTPGRATERISGNEVDLFSVSWLESQAFAQHHNRDAEFWRQLQSLCAERRLGEFVDSGSDCLVFATEDAVLKLCMKAQAGTDGRKLVTAADRVLAATRNRRVRGLAVRALTGETFLAYALSCERCRKDDRIRPTAAEVLDFVAACLRAGVFPADVAACNFMAGHDGRIVFVDHSDYSEYAPDRWPLFVDRLQTTTGVKPSTDVVPVDADAALRTLREIQRALPEAVE